MGNRPTPTATRKLSGSNLHRVNKKEAHFKPIEEMDIPEEVRADKYALEEWERMFPEAVENRLLNRANLAEFMAICFAYAAWMHADDQVAEQGYWLTDKICKDGVLVSENMKLNPALRIAAQSRIEMRLHEIEFGFTPAGATKVYA